MVCRGQIYKHYKGSSYLVIEVATHTETNEKLVVYCNIQNKSQIWARPLEMFESVMSDGRSRFELMVEAGYK